MEYHKIKNLLGNTPNQSSKFKIKNWVEINADSRGVYNINSQIKLKTSMLRSILCDYSDAYVLATETITVPTAAGAAPNNANKKVISNNCAPFTDYKSGINNTEVDHAKDIDVPMPINNLIKHKFYENICKFMAIL